MIDYVAFLLFVIFMVGTPGPANMLLMTSGANFGFWQSLPFVAGVTFGKLLLNILLALGLWELLSHDARIVLALKIVCVGYLAWLALRMSGFLMARRELRQPESFWKGLAVHPLNPKAWAMLVFAYAQFTDSAQPLIPQAIIISLTFLVVQVVLHCIWCAGGAMLVATVGGRPAERWLMRSLSVVTVLVVIWAILLG